MRFIGTYANSAALLPLPYSGLTIFASLLYVGCSGAKVGGVFYVGRREESMETAVRRRRCGEMCVFTQGESGTCRLS